MTAVKKIEALASAQSTPVYRRRGLIADTQCSLGFPAKLNWIPHAATREFNNALRHSLFHVRAMHRRRYCSATAFQRQYHHFDGVGIKCFMLKNRRYSVHRPLLSCVTGGGATPAPLHL